MAAKKILRLDEMAEEIKSGRVPMRDHWYKQFNFENYLVMENGDYESALHPADYYFYRVSGKLADQYSTTNANATVPRIYQEDGLWVLKFESADFGGHTRSFVYYYRDKDSLIKALMREET